MKPRPTDCIFVFAGRSERKTYALQLFREGYAKRIIISVGRFEWRRFLKLGLEDDGGLQQLVEKTPAPQRHFFVYMDESHIKAFLVRKHRFGTLGEAIALFRFVKSLDLRSLMIISSAFHLRRARNVAQSRRKNFEIELIPVAIPDELASERRTTWWKTSRGISLIVSEYFKNALYSLILNPFYKFT